MGGDLSRLAGSTLQLYERHAARYDAERAKILFERAWLDRFAGPLKGEAAILDLGCGAGDPIAVHLLDQGFRVTGIDGAPSMIRLARSRRPDADWRVADMRTLQLDERFDGVIAWDSFFHLTPDEQRDLLPRLAALLNPQGRLMLTVGPEAGEVIGHVGGEEVYHASLSAQEYAAILARDSLRVLDFVAEDPACDYHSVLLAQKA